MLGRLFCIGIVQFLALTLGIVIVLGASSGRAAVNFYSGQNCTGYHRTFAHGGQADLSAVYYEGTSVSMNNSISSIFIDSSDGGWDVVTCDNSNFFNCAAQLNTEPDTTDEDRCINLITGSWNSLNPYPVNNAISSLWIQPNSFDAYWEIYDFREDSSQSGDRYGYVELFTETNYRGIGFKNYTSKTELLGTPVGHATQSIRLHGNLVARLCTAQGNNCATYVSVDEDIPDIGFTVYGIQTLVASYSSAMAMKSSDLPEQPDEFVDAFLEEAPANMRKSFYKWAESGYGTTHDVAWAGDCYDVCNAGNDPETSTDECVSIAACDYECVHNMCAYAKLLNHAGYRYAGDSSIVFIGGHGNFDNATWRAPNALIQIFYSGCCNHELSLFRSRMDWPCSECGFEWTDTDEGSTWGNFNTDWVVTTACHSLGNPDEGVSLILSGSTLNNYVVAHAWKSLLLSGVHGIGGFYNEGHWRSGPADESGAELSAAFWSDLQTKSFAQSWGETNEGFNIPDDPDRVVYVLYACPLWSTDAECVQRMDNDYYQGYQSGPQPDLRGPDLRFHIEVYEP